MLGNRSIGINSKDDGSCSIKIWAPQAKTVAVQIYNSAEILPLIQGDQGYWISGENVFMERGTKYRIVLDGGEPVPDPASISQPEGVHGPSQLINLSYDWLDFTWVNPPLKEYIIYEIHTGTFSEQGSFAGIIAHLDHLVDLGITAVELMPVASFPGSRNWGYDGVFPFAVQQSYGGAYGLQQLVDRCHTRGLAVILDVVYNHLGPEGNYFNLFGPYFTDKYQTPWGDAVNCDDAYCDGMRKFITENVLMWFRDFHIDALRLDAVHAIKDYSAIHILQQVRVAVDQLMADTGRKHYLIGECDLNDPRYISPFASNGLGLDAQWIDEFHHALRVTAGEPPKGYYSDFSGIEHLEKSYKDGYVYTGQYSSERNKRFGRKPEGHPGSQFVVFSQNHDHVGNRMLGERSSQLFSFEMLKLMAGAVLCSPYVPLLFMGEEWADTNPFLYFISHTDEDLVRLVREGRQEEFAEMHQGGEAPDPQSEQTFLRSKLNWQRVAIKPHQTMFNFYKNMIALRKDRISLNAHDHSTMKTICIPEKKCLLLERGIEGDRHMSLILMNFSSSVQSVNAPSSLQNFIMIADSAAEEWGGPKAAIHVPQPDTSIELQPESFIVYAATYV
jgi:maltooligosyltrehalose trehalohydrolase